MKTHADRQRKVRRSRRHADQPEEIAHHPAMPSIDLNHLSAANVMQLQRTIGNRATQRLLIQRSPAITQGNPGTIQRGWFDDVVDTVSDTASGAWDAVSDTASDVAGAVADTASDAWDTVSDTASDAWDTVSDTASDAWDTASDAWDTVTDAAGEAYDTVTSYAGEVWDSVAGAAGVAWDTLSDSAKAAWEGVVNAAEAVGGLAQDAWAGLISLGESAWNWLANAGREVWDAIRWFGSKAWNFIKDVGIFVWEKICFYGDLLWSFISNIPSRLWRLIVDAWDAIVGVMSWLGEGAAGFAKWLSEGLAGAADWAIEFLSDPSLDGLGRGVKRFLSWALDGGMGALGWLWDGIKGGAEWALTVALHLLELLGLGEALSAMWGTIFDLRPLDSSETAAGESILGSLVPYDLVWVDEGSLITTIANKFGPGRTLAVTTMHLIHYPGKGSMPGDLAVHELTHVAQYEQIGAIYMAQALHAQMAGSKYELGDLNLVNFSDLDREAQAELAGEYYKHGGDGAPEERIVTTRGGTKNTMGRMRELINQMRAGNF